MGCQKWVSERARGGGRCAGGVCGLRTHISHAVITLDGRGASGFAALTCGDFLLSRGPLGLVLALGVGEGLCDGGGVLGRHHRCWG